MRLLYWIRRLLGLLPPAQWTDGVVVHDPVYAAIYAKTVEWVKANAPDAPITASVFVLTVRLYDRWPKGSEYNWGRVLAPNIIPGDTGGTLCLAETKAHDVGIITHECKHAITGVGDHPAWLFPGGA